MSADIMSAIERVYLEGFDSALCRKRQCRLRFLSRKLHESGGFSFFFNRDEEGND